MNNRQQTDERDAVVASLYELSFAGAPRLGSGAQLRRHAQRVAEILKFATDYVVKHEDDLAVQILYDNFRSNHEYALTFLDVYDEGDISDDDLRRLQATWDDPLRSRD